MSKGEKVVPELVAAAQALEAELVRLEELSRSVRKIRLHSDKNIARAAKELNDALALPDRIAEQLRVMALAMASMQGRQEAALQPLAVAAADINARLQRLGVHMEAFALLGKAASEVTVLLQTEGESESVLAAVDSRLTEITDGARALFEAARTDDFPDVAREADALKQRIAAVRVRLKHKAKPPGPGTTNGAAS